MSNLIRSIAVAGLGLAASMAAVPDASALPAGAYVTARSAATAPLEHVQFYGGYGYGYGYPYGFYGRPFGYGYYGRGFGYGRGYYGRGYYGRGGRGFYGRR